MKNYKPTLFSESTSTRPSSLVPNIRALSWSPTGALIATCTSAHIRIWNPERPNVKSSTEIRNGHNSSFAGGPGGSGAVVEKIAFCPTTESVLASTGHDGGVRLWDVRVPGGAAGGGKGTQLADCKVGDPVLFLTWHPDGREMLVGTKEDAVYSLDVRKTMNFDDAISQWTLDATEGTPAGERSASLRYYAMCFSNSGREVFATTGDGPVKILDYPSMELLHTVSGHGHATYAVQQSPRGDWLAVGGGDSIITLWDTGDWHCSHALTAHTSAIRDLSFSFDGAFIIAGSGSDARDGLKGIEIYHADTGDVVHTIDTTHAVTTAAFHPYRYWVAYAGDAGGLKIVGVGSGI
jgi:THO complex subunit 3